ncbi:MAG: DNA polymerase III subunit delta [Flavobacteriales bacterium]
MGFEEIIKEIKQKKIHPIYILAGEEAYFIDALCNYIENALLTEEEKSFNLSVFYGVEANADDVIAAARRFPMMAEYNVVILKEAQLMKSLEKLEPYLNTPTSSTVLIICHKYKNLDERTKFTKAAKKWCFFKSNKLKEADIINFIVKYLTNRKCRITANAAKMIFAHVGYDLEKIINEINKVLLNYPNGLEFTEKIIEEYIGISRTYNVFELQKALSYKHVARATEIAFAMAKDEKNNPIQAVNAALFSYFTKVLHTQYLQSKKANDIAKIVGVPPFFMAEYEAAARNYSPQKLVKIIYHIKDYDLRSKGVNSNTDAPELLKELVYKILN